MEAKKEQTKERILAELEECRRQAEEYLQGWQRERADSLNAKKEMREYGEQAAERARQTVFEEFFEVLDNLERAEKACVEEQKKSSEIQGFLHIGRQIRDIFSRHGIQEMEVPIGQRFDPNLHEAVQKEDGQGREEGSILEVVGKGYRMKGRILRCAKVKVAQ